jgi:hypothetical protein
MVEALYIAATQENEAAVEAYLKDQLECASLTLANLQRHFKLLSDTNAPTLDIPQHSLDSYDQLLPSVVADSTESLREFEPPSQRAATFQYAQVLGDYRKQGHTGTVVLRAVLACFMRIGASEANAGQTKKGTHRSTTSQRKKFYQL